MVAIACARELLPPLLLLPLPLGELDGRLVAAPRILRAQGQGFWEQGVRHMSMFQAHYENTAKSFVLVLILCSISHYAIGVAMETTKVDSTPTQQPNLHGMRHKVFRRDGAD
jgi:hypothetical protein